MDGNRPYAQVLEERNESGEVETAFIYGDDLLTQLRDGETRHYLYQAVEKFTISGCSKNARCEAQKKFKIDAYFSYARF